MLRKNGKEKIPNTGIWYLNIPIVFLIILFGIILIPVSVLSSQNFPYIPGFSLDSPPNHMSGEGAFISNNSSVRISSDTSETSRRVKQGILSESQIAKRITTSETKSGTVLADESGISLYYFTVDIPSSNTSACIGECTFTWEPFSTGDDNLSSFKRPDGIVQATYQGWPLYLYKGDAVAGDIKGDGLNNSWFAVKPNQNIFIAHRPFFGSFLTDGFGRTLYYYLNDTPGLTHSEIIADIYLSGPQKNHIMANDTFGISACTKECEVIWPGFKADNTSVPSALNQSEFRSLKVGTYRNQTAYMGRLLYYSSLDLKPGDVNGLIYTNTSCVADISGRLPNNDPILSFLENITPNSGQWFHLMFRNNGIVLQDSSSGSLGSVLNGSLLRQDSPLVIQGQLGGIFMAGSGVTKIGNVSFNTNNNSLVEIDPGTGYRVAINKKPDSADQSTPQSPKTDSQVYFMVVDGKTTQKSEKPVCFVRADNGNDFSVNITVDSSGFTGYHIRTLKESGGQIYDFSNIYDLPAGVTFDDRSRTISFEPTYLPDQPVTYILSRSLSVSGITPSSAVNDGELTTKIVGSQFDTTTQIFLTKTGTYSIPASQVTILSSGIMECTFPISHVETGLWDVLVKNTDEPVATLSPGLTIVSPSSILHFSEVLNTWKTVLQDYIRNTLIPTLLHETKDQKNYTQKADVWLTNSTDLSSIKIQYRIVNTDDSSLSGSKYRNDLRNSGEYDDGGDQPGNTIVWMFKTGDTVYSSPTIMNGTLYVGSADSHLYAIDALSGEKKWEYTTYCGVYSSPAVDNNTVYIGCGDSHIFAIDAITGEEKWRYLTRHGVHSGPAVAHGMVYVGSDDNTLYALSILNGEPKWKHPVERPTSPAIEKNRVYVGSSDSYVYALDATTGEEKWRFQTGDMIRSSPALGYGMVYIGSDDNRVYAIDAMTGQEKWRFQTGARVKSSPAVSDGIVYIGSDDSWIYALDAMTGRRIWMYETGNEVRSSPAVANGVVYVGGYDSYVYALDAKTGGREKWMIKTGGPINSSPAVGYGMVFIGSDDSYVYALGNSPYLQVQVP